MRKIIYENLPCPFCEAITIPVKGIPESRMVVHSRGGKTPFTTKYSEDVYDNVTILVGKCSKCDTGASKIARKWREQGVFRYCYGSDGNDSMPEDVYKHPKKIVECPSKLEKRIDEVCYYCRYYHVCEIYKRGEKDANNPTTT